ncbi:hypothetical protein D3C72_2103140 [compost metagenome]
MVRRLPEKPFATAASVFAVAGSTSSRSCSAARRPGLSVGQSCGRSPLMTRSTYSAIDSGLRKLVAFGVISTLSSQSRWSLMMRR